MSATPLLDQIRVYSEALVEDLPEAPPARPQPHRRQRRPGWAYAVTGAVAVLVLVGGGFWLVRPSTPAVSAGFDWDAYFTAVTPSALLLREDPTVLQLQAAGPEPLFDTSALGFEVALEPVENDAGIPTEILSEIKDGPTGELTPIGPFLYAGQVAESGRLLAVYQVSGGVCMISGGPSSIQIGCSGRDEGYGLYRDVHVFVPLETSVVAITTLDGQRLWQRPIGGWALFDLPDPPQGSPPHSIDAYDAFGNLIGQWGSDPSELEAWAATTTTTLPLTSDEALAIADAYFDAYNAGDWDGVTSVFARIPQNGFDDIEFSFGRGGSGLGWGDLFFDIGVAQGTVRTPPSCTVPDDQPAESMVVSCVFETLDAPTQAVGAPPVPTTARLTITTRGLSRVEEIYDGEIDLEHVGEPFRNWLAANRIDENCLAQSVGNRWCDEWRSGDVEEWREVGRLIAQYADEWAAYLKENACTYLDGC